MNAKSNVVPVAVAFAMKLFIVSQTEAAPWIPTKPMMTNHSGHTATLLTNGTVLVAGGGNPITELYDVASGDWTATGSMMAYRVDHTATLLTNGKVLVAEQAREAPWPNFVSTELYDPATGTWASTNSLLNPRYQHTATLLTNGRVLVVGGIDSGSSSSRRAEIYNPSNGMWTATGDLNTGRHSHTATLLANGKVLVAGGYDNRTPVILSSVEIYDPSTGRWITTPGLRTRRYQHTATLLTNGMVLVAGGNSGSPLSSAELYDPATGFWTFTGSLSAREEHTATLLPNGRVLVTGGRNSTALSSATIYDPVARTWTATDSMTTNRVGHTATLLPNRKVLVVGGANDFRAELYELPTDLSPVHFSWSATPGTVEFRYENFGKALTSSTSAKLFWAAGVRGTNKLSNTPVFTHNIPSDFIGRSEIVSVPPPSLQNPSNAATHLLLMIDPENVIAENNETNNISTLNITQPDLLPASIGWNQSGGLDFSYTVQTVNVGISSTTAKLFWANGSAASDKLSDSAFFTQSIPAGFSGQSSIITVASGSFQSPPTNATHVLLVVDPDNVITESSENNNVLPVMLLPPDLDVEVSAFTWKSTVAGPTYSLEGVGSAAANQAAISRFFWARGPTPADKLSSTPVVQTTNNFLFDGRAQTFILNRLDLLRAPDGATHLIVEANAEGAFEANEGLASITGEPAGAGGGAASGDNFMALPLPCQLMALEVIQVIQDWRNSIPLVKGKETIIRAHIRSTGSKEVDVSKARLVVTAGNGPPEILPPDADPFTARPSPQRSEYKQSLNFKLENPWLDGVVTFRLDMAGCSFAEPAEAGGIAGDGIVRLSFETVPPLDIALISVTWQKDEREYITQGAAARYYAGRLQSLFPTPFVPVNYGWLPFGGSGFGDLLKALKTKRDFDIANRGVSSQRVYHGFVPDPDWAFDRKLDKDGEAEVTWRVIDVVPGQVSTHRFRALDPATSSHELYDSMRKPAEHEVAHLMGREHTVNFLCPPLKCGWCDDSKPLEPMTASLAAEFYPYWHDNNPIISSVGDALTEIYGLRLEDDQPKVVRPLATELMSYCLGDDLAGKWISDYTYTNLLRAIQRKFAPVQESEQQPLFEASSPAGFLLVRGSIDLANNTADLLPFWRLSSAPPNTGVGDHTVEARTANGSVLESFRSKLPSLLRKQTRSARFIFTFGMSPIWHRYISDKEHKHWASASVAATLHPSVLSLQSAGKHSLMRLWLSRGQAMTWTATPSTTYLSIAEIQAFRGKRSVWTLPIISNP
jgi:hypothetical protein